MAGFKNVIADFSARLPLFFGMKRSNDYKKQTGLTRALNALMNKQKILSEKNEGQISYESWSPDREYRLEDTVVLTKKKNRDFIVLSLTDVHFSDYDYRAYYAFEGTLTIKRLVVAVQPDLITVSGDIVCGKSDKYAIARFTDLMESFGIPWAPIFGNHDREANCDLNYLADIMMKSPHCVMKKGDPSAGVGNYIINIVEENDDGSVVPCESLIMYYSRFGNTEKLKSWYAWACDGIKKLSGGKAETALFTHIPIAEYQYAHDEAWDETAGKWRDGYKAYGKRNEDIGVDYDADGKPVLDGFFDTIKENGTKFFFCGHDHMNDFSIEYQGVRLTYILKLGYGSGFQKGYNGGTVISIKSDGIGRITHKTVSYGIMKDIVDIDTKK